MNIEYTKVGDYYLPNLVAPENMKNFKLGKYGKLRLRYLKEHKNAEYIILLMDNKLQKHLLEVDKNLPLAEVVDAYRKVVIPNGLNVVIVGGIPLIYFRMYLSAF